VKSGRKLFILLFSVLVASNAYSQEVRTAMDFFNQVASRYAAIEDYQANITITRGNTVMTGVLSHKAPNLLRINFTRPEDQVIVFNGERLVVFIPRFRVVMSQHTNPRDHIAVGASLATRDGLALLRRNYTIAFFESPNPVPLDRGVPGSEMVTKLRLVWRSTEEGFRQIVLSVGENGLIRRFVGTTPENDVIQFDFLNIAVNQGIPAARFDFNPPPGANTFENFLFEPRR